MVRRLRRSSRPELPVTGLPDIPAEPRKPKRRLACLGVEDAGSEYIQNWLTATTRQTMPTQT